MSQDEKLEEQMGQQTQASSRYKSGKQVEFLEQIKNQKSVNIMHSVPTIRFKPFASICLAVILSIISATKIDNVNGEQQVSHLSHSQNALFKDLSGPTSGKIQTLDVICGKNFMTVRAEFSGPFYGIVFSKGTYGHENCIYVKPNSGLTHAAFNVYYDQCGTKPDLQGKFYENTIVIQYGSDIIEAYDEAKRLRCEWFEAYEKPATFKPAIPVADLEVVEMNFQGDDIDCWMEIQEGTGPWSREVSKIVPVGQPMTIVVAINDYNGQFDMRVKSCVAHDGVQQPIALTDEYGCVLRPKMLTPFTKMKNPGADKKATVLSYSRFLAFKFPDTMNVQIQCTVEVCRHGCAEACQRVPSIAATTLQPELSLSARWPAASNQAAIEGPRAPTSPRRQQQEVGVFGQANEPAESPYKPARVQFNRQNQNQIQQQQPAAVEPFRAQPYAGQPGSSPQAPPSDMGEDMSGSDSNQQPSLVVHPRRPQLDNPLEGRLPQYLMPGARRSSPPVVRSEHPPTSTPQTIASSTTSAASSAPEAPTTSAKPEVSRAGNVEEPTEPAGDDSLTRLRVGNSEQQVNEQQDNKAEASQVKPSIVAPDDGQPASASSDSQTNPQEQADNKPSVQGGDDQVDNSESAINNQQGSSLKTVEVEIPANDDQVGTLIASSTSNNNNNPANFNSARINNVDLSSNWGYNTGYDDQRRSDSQTAYKQPEQVIQPREASTSSEKRADKSEDQGIAVAESTIAVSKTRFGDRSQQTQPAMQAAAPEEPAAPLTHYNHQMLAADHGSQDGAAKEESSNPDRVLIDRSDDSSDLASSSVDAPVKPDAVVNQEESVAAPVDSSSSGGKVKPVVGTEELASGPLQIEDRIGSSAQESLEEALSRLQQQIPQTAALIGAKEQPEQKTVSGAAVKPDERADAQETGQKVDDRLDLNNVLAQNKKINDNARPVQKQTQSQSGLNQPYPNVVGQAKVIPDPSSSLSTRGSMLAQASSSEGAVVALPVQQKQQQTPSQQVSQAPRQPEISQQQQQQQQQQQTPNSKPVAQITNIPINIGFPQNQIPAVQQFSQQLAMIQQQQQQQQFQQQQQLKSSTAKPTRSRFNLLSPQAALHAVASRFLPKSAAHQAVQPQLPIAQQVPQMLNEQQKLALMRQQQQQQQQHQQTLLLSKQTQQQQQQQQYLPNRFATPQQQMAPSLGSNLFGRLNNYQQSQPLVRTRRSAMMSNGKPGNGEVGITKTFMVVTGMDLAFLPNATETKLPPILEGRRIPEDDVIYGVCMPVVSLTFVLTCAFWLIVFIFSFCIYMLIKSRRQRSLYQDKESMSR